MNKSGKEELKKLWAAAETAATLFKRRQRKAGHHENDRSDPLLALLAAGCAAAPGAPTREAPSHRVPLEAGSFGGVAWLPNGWLVLSRDAAPDSPETLFRLRPDGSGLQRLPIPGDPACLAIRHDSPVSLGDGRVAFLYSCSVALGPDQIFVKAFDPGTGRTSQLTARPLEGYFSGTITWSTLKDRGMIGDSVAPCMSIAWLTPQGVEPAAITISEGDQSWRLDELHKRGGSDCNDLGTAGWPGWSPDGQSIVGTVLLPMQGPANDELVILDVGALISDR